MFKRIIFFNFIFLAINGIFLIYSGLKFPLAKVRDAVRERGEFVLTNDVRVKTVFSDSPAEKVGFQSEDIITSIDGTAVNDLDTFIGLVNKSKGGTIQVTISRQNIEKVFQVIPTYNSTYNRYTIGVEVVNYQFQEMPLVKLIPKTLVSTFQGRNDTNPFIKTGWISLFGLVNGICMILISIGVYKLKKWAAIFYIILGLSYLVTFFGMPFLVYQSRLSIINDFSLLTPYIFAIVTVPSSFYFILKWKDFN